MYIFKDSFDKIDGNNVLTTLDTSNNNVYRFKINVEKRKYGDQLETAEVKIAAFVNDSVIHINKYFIELNDVNDTQILTRYLCKMATQWMCNKLPYYIKMNMVILIREELEDIIRDSIKEINKKEDMSFSLISGEDA